MSSEQKRMLGDVEIKIGQVWRAPWGTNKGQVVGFNTGGTALIEILVAGTGYKVGEITRLSNMSWVLEPEKKKVKYQLFKLNDGRILGYSGENLEYCQTRPDIYKPISPELEYDYTEQVGE